jgi:LPXTG-site transpeptidase (sortase) family protein
MKYIKPKLLIPFGLIIFGFAIFMLSGRNQQTVDFPITSDIVKDNSSAQDIQNSNNENLAVQLSEPVSLQVSSIDLNLPIEKGYYNKNTQQWNISTTSAFWSVMTSKPNNKEGITFIYGHNRSSVFSKLGKMQEGSIATVTTEDGKTHNYRLKYSFTTNPEDSSILNYQGPPILALQTCSGATFQNRTIYVFEYIGNQNA